MFSRHVVWPILSISFVGIALFIVYLKDAREREIYSGSAEGAPFSIVYYPSGIAQITIHAMNPDKYPRAVADAFTKIKEDYLILKIKRIFANNIHVAIEPLPHPLKTGGG